MSEIKTAKAGPGWFGILWRSGLRLALIGVFIVVVMLICVWWTAPAVGPAREIFHGVVYECRQVSGPEGSGKAHLIRVDLKEPGIELYLTPESPEARAAGAEYETRWAPRVARDEGLAVAINAVLFNATVENALPGGYVKTVETMIVEGKINHEYGPQSLVWFEKDLSPHLEVGRPPSKEVMAKAHWAIGSQLLIYYHNTMSQYVGRDVGRRTYVGINEEQKLLFFGVFEDASDVTAIKMLADFGAQDIVPMDGGSSTSLTFGPGAKGVSPGAAVYPLRSLPVFIGVKARPLD